MVTLKPKCKDMDIEKHSETGAGGGGVWNEDRTDWRKPGRKETEDKTLIIYLCDETLLFHPHLRVVRQSITNDEQAGIWNKVIVGYSKALSQCACQGLNYICTNVSQNGRYWNRL